MDADRFDAISRSLASLGTRRHLFQLLIGLPLLSSTAPDEIVAKRRKRSRGRLRAEACIPTGKSCPSKKPRGHNKRGDARVLSCNRCCQGHVATVNGASTCACQPDTMPCITTTECCAGVCTNGSCVSNPSPPPPPPRCPSGQTLCEDDVCRDCCPDCAGNECGSDGCGGSCGSGVCDGCGNTCCRGICCPAGPAPDFLREVCFAGECCLPQCANVACGAGTPAQTCGLASCGTCSGDNVCVNGACNGVCNPNPCTPPGPDGCGNCLVRPNGTHLCATLPAGAGTGTCRSDAECCPGELCAAIPGAFEGRFVCYAVTFGPACTTP